MPNTNQVITVIHEWIQKAENDLKNASHTLRLGATCPTDTVCFHAQQCVEKYLKALLVYRGMDVPRTHDIRLLISLLPAKMCPEISLQDQRTLTGYAVAGRYPGVDDIALAEARQAVKIARRARREIRKFLPKEALGGKRR